MFAIPCLCHEDPSAVLGLFCSCSRGLLDRLHRLLLLSGVFVFAGTAAGFSGFSPDDSMIDCFDLSMYDLGMKKLWSLVHVDPVPS